MIIRVPHTFLFKVIFSLLCLVFLYTLTLRIILVFSYIPETGGASLDVLYGILRILKGRNLYNNPELPPYAVVQCMPLYYYVVAGLSQILGISQSIHAVSVINRLCALGFNLLLFIPLQRILRKIFDCQEKFSHWTTFLAIFILIPSADYSGTGSLCLLATAFSIYYFLCFLNLYDDKYGSELVLSGIGASLAFFINQYSFFLLVCILLFLLIYIRDKKATLLFVISSSIALLFLFIILIGVNANYWFLNVTYGIKSLFTVYDFKNMGELPLHNFLYIALLSLLLGAFFFMKRLKLREKFLRFIALCNILFVLTDSFYIGPKFISISLLFSIVLLLTFVELKELDSVTRLKKIF